MEQQVYTVSQLNRYVKQLFVYDYLLNNVYVGGEISNLKKHSSGHYYFTLKDREGAIQAVMFKSHAQTLRFKPEEGMAIVVKGYVSLYEKTGQYQLYVQHMEPEGQGALYKAFEQLKQKLEDEGLFSHVHKKQIPYYPKKIGIVTSGTGAAVRDIIKVSQRRNPRVQLIVYPTLVQGEQASSSIEKAINYFNSMSDIDVLIVGRGGGSIEDLWAFNEERTARAIFASKIPIISAVGHETDFTIADFVSDLRAPTPSAAAELAVPSLTEIFDTLHQLQIRLKQSTRKTLDIYQHRLLILEKHPALRAPQQKIDDRRQQLDLLLKSMGQAKKDYFEKCKNRLELANTKLQILNPAYTIERGYAIALDDDDNPISSVRQAREAGQFWLKLADGEIRVSIEGSEKDERN